LDVASVEVEFKNLTVKIATSYRFKENTGEIEITRKFIESSDPDAVIEIDEFLTSCWGTTEYPEDLTGCILSVEDEKGTRTELSYDYRSRTDAIQNAKIAAAVIPYVQTKISLITKQSSCTGYFEEGYSFAPNLKIGLYKTVKLNEELLTCLKVEQAK